MQFAKAGFDASVASYRDTVLNAFRDGTRKNDLMAAIATRRKTVVNGGNSRSTTPLTQPGGLWISPATGTRAGW